MPLKQGKTYRDTDTGVVGVATEIRANVPQDAVRGPGGMIAMPPQSMARLSLRREHIETGDHTDQPKGHDLRWYHESRLEDVTDGQA